LAEQKEINFELETQLSNLQQKQHQIIIATQQEERKESDQRMKAAMEIIEEENLTLRKTQEAEIDRLSDEVVSLKEENVDLKASNEKMAHFQTQLTRLEQLQEDTLRKHGTQMDEQKKKYAQLDSIREDLVSRLTALETEHFNLIAQYQLTNSSLQEKESTLEELQRMLEEQEQSRVNQDARINELQTECDEWKVTATHRAELQDRVDQLEGQPDTEAVRAELTGKLEQMGMERDEWKEAALKEAESRTSEASLHARIRQLEEENRQLTDAAIEVSKSLDAMEHDATLRELRRSLDHSEAKQAELQSEIELLKRQRDQWRETACRQVETGRTNASSTEYAELQSSVLRLEIENKRLLEKHQLALKVAAASAATAAVEQDHSMGQVLESLDQSQVKQVELESEIAMLTQERQHWEDSAHEAWEQVTTAAPSGGDAGLLERVQELEDEKKNLVLERDQAFELAEQATSQAMEKDDSLTGMQEHMKAHERFAEELRVEIESIRMDRDRWKEEADECRTLLEASNKSSACVAADMGTRVQSVEAENASLLLKHQESLDSLSKITNDVETVSLDRDQWRRLAEHATEKAATMASLMAPHADLQQHLEMLLEQSSDVESEATDEKMAHLQKVDAKAALGAIKRRLDDLTKTNRDLRSRQELFDKMERDLSSVCKERGAWKSAGGDSTSNTGPDCEPPKDIGDNDSLVRDKETEEKTRDVCNHQRRLLEELETELKTKNIEADVARNQLLGLQHQIQHLGNENLFLRSEIEAMKSARNEPESLPKVTKQDERLCTRESKVDTTSEYGNNAIFSEVEKFRTALEESTMHAESLEVTVEELQDELTESERIRERLEYDLQDKAHLEREFDQMRRIVEDIRQENLILSQDDEMMQRNATLAELRRIKNERDSLKTMLVEAQSGMSDERPDEPQGSMLTVSGFRRLNAGEKTAERRFSTRSFDDIEGTSIAGDSTDGASLGAASENLQADFLAAAAARNKSEEVGKRWRRLSQRIFPKMRESNMSLMSYASGDYEGKEKNAEALEKIISSQKEDINKLRSDVVRIQSNFREEAYLNKVKIEKLMHENEAYLKKVAILEKEFQKVNSQVADSKDISIEMTPSSNISDQSSEMEQLSRQLR